MQLVLIGYIKGLMKSKMIQAKTFLGFQLVLHFIKKIFRIGQKGKKDFLAAYKNDGIFAISEKHRGQMPDYSRCYLCGLCDSVCPDIALNLNFMAPSFMVAGFSRSLTDFALLPKIYNCDSCQLCEQACPQKIPIREIINFMRAGQNG